MGKKCPQEEYHASAAKTTPAYQSLPPNLPADSKGALGCLAPPRRPHPEGRTLVPLTLPFL